MLKPSSPRGQKRLFLGCEYLRIHENVIFCIWYSREYQIAGLVTTQSVRLRISWNAYKNADACSTCHWSRVYECMHLDTALSLVWRHVSHEKIHTVYKGSLVFIQLLSEWSDGYACIKFIDCILTYIYIHQCLHLKLSSSWPFHWYDHIKASRVPIGGLLRWQTLTSRMYYTLFWLILYFFPWWSDLESRI